jgi:pimeloyl-ACP methyl ester carboxylesterase
MIWPGFVGANVRRTVGVPGEQGAWTVSALRVMLLPGIVLPADLAYGGLVTVLGADVETIVKDLEVYREDSPPPDYSLDTEVAGVLREADAHGWSSFHLVGYSGGGAAALAVAARQPARLLSLALLEPAWAGNWGWSPKHSGLWATYDELEQLPPEQFMPAFMRLQVRPEVRLSTPPAGPPPAWMRQRPAGIRALMRTFKTYTLDRDALAAFEGPVYFALGGLSNPDHFGEVAERLGKVFPDFTLEVWDERHHFDPPHRIEPERLAGSLRAIWARGSQAHSGVLSG